MNAEAIFPFLGLAYLELTRKLFLIYQAAWLYGAVAPWMVIGLRYGTAIADYGRRLE